MATTTLTRTQQRIDQLLAHDTDDTAAFDGYYQDCLRFISTHLMAFYVRYADENGLSMKQTQQRVSAWDLRQWKQAIDSIDMANWDAQAKQRARVIGIQAGFSRTAMLGALVSIGVVAMTANYQQSIIDRVRADGLDEIKHATTQFPIRGQERAVSKQRKKRLRSEPKKLTSIVDQASTKEMWSANLWLDSDKLAHDVQYLVTKRLRHGMTVQDMQELLQAHDNKAQFKPTQSAADRLAQSKLNARRILITESQRVNYHVDLTSMMIRGVKYVNWVNEPKSCDNCQGLADMSPYNVNDCPKIPEDSHPNCRCHIEPAQGVEATKVTGFNTLT